MSFPIAGLVARFDPFTKRLVIYSCDLVAREVTAFERTGDA